jgi:hypothetical protein
MGVQGNMRNGLARVVGAAAALLAVGVAAVLALVFAATVIVTAVIATALVGVTVLALRARRTARVRATTPGVIDARRVGHTWVAYGWNEPRR